jgi:hypothetical protein
MNLVAGTKLGRYEIRSKIGEGGMGEVYRALDPKINREVAIKILPPALSADKDRLARFEQEAQAAGALNHPNILDISVSQNGTLVFWNAGAANRQLVWFDRTGKRLNVVGAPGEYNDVVLSPDEKREALKRDDNTNSDIWLFQVRGAESLRCFAGWTAFPNQLGSGRSQPHYDRRA